MRPEELMAIIQLLGYSPPVFAEAIGVTSQAMSYWLTGKRKISKSTEMLIRIVAKYPGLLKEFKP